MTTYNSVNSATFIADNLGVQAHTDATNTPYGNISAVISAMHYIGFDNVREAPTNMSAWQTLASQGFHFDAETATPWAMSLSDFQSRLDQIESAYPGSIMAVEGANEADGGLSYGGLTGMAGLLQLQTDIYHMVKSDPLLSGIQVYDFSLASSTTSDYQALGNLSSIADAQPMHYYYGGGEPSWIWQQLLGDAQLVVPNGPHVFTEIGSSTAPNTYWAVDETVQAKQTLNVVMDAARTNSTVFFYELVNNNMIPNNPYENNLGLFHSDWTPKPAATALHNLTQILTNGADPHATPDSLTYSISGWQSGGWESYSTVFEKTAATHDIAVWWEPDIWNDNTQTEIPIAPFPITVSLGATYASVDIYDPLSGTTPVQHLSSVSTVTVNLSDHPLIIEVSNASGSTAPAPAPAPAPAAPSTPALTPASDTGLSNTDNITNDNTPVFVGAAVAGSTVKLYDGSTLIGSGTADANGSWSVTSSVLADGAHVITATDTTAGGTSAASAGLAVTVDTWPPSAPTTPDMTAASDNGASNTDNITSITTPTFTGSVASAPNAVVTLYDGSTEIGTATVDSSGNWSITSTPLALGSHSITATATDVAGNVSTASGALAVSIVSSSATATTTTSTPGVVISGGHGSDNLVGTAGNDTISGGPGADTITGGAGDDLLTGGKGADRFVFGVGFGHDTITDFHHAQSDQLVFTGFGGEQPTITDSSAGVVFKFLSGDTVTLSGVHSVTAGDWIVN